MIHWGVCQLHPKERLLISNSEGFSSTTASTSREDSKFRACICIRTGAEMKGKVLLMHNNSREISDFAELRVNPLHCKLIPQLLEKSSFSQTCLYCFALFYVLQLTKSRGRVCQLCCRLDEARNSRFHLEVAERKLVGKDFPAEFHTGSLRVSLSLFPSAPQRFGVFI